MAMRCLVIVIGDYDIGSYYEKLDEGINYIRVKNSEEAKTVMEDMKEERWKEVIDASFDWWKRNCSVEGSFRLTNKILEDNSCQ